MTFLIDFPNVFRSTMDLKNFSESYNILLGFGITIVVEFLKWLGRCSKSKHALAMAIMLLKHVLSLMMLLRCHYESLSGLGADELLHLTIVLVNSISENNAHDNKEYKSNLFSTFSSI